MPTSDDDNHALNVGLYFKSSEQRLEWLDGSLPAPDTPWDKDPSSVTESIPYAPLKTDGTIKFTGGNRPKLTICGNSKTQLFPFQCEPKI